MRLVNTFLVILFSSSLCLAQREELLTDEKGKFIHYELIEANGALKETLKQRANSFLKKVAKDVKLKFNHGDTTFVAQGKLIIHKTLLVMSHPSGEILYRLEIDIRDEKFRFWLTDFTFVAYQRDRYGNFVPSSTKGIPLENNPGKLNASQWKEYQLQTATYAGQFADELKQFMAGKEIPLPTATERTIVKKSWK
jgi:hypothetical protein